MFKLEFEILIHALEILIFRFILDFDLISPSIIFLPDSL